MRIVLIFSLLIAALSLLRAAEVAQPSGEAPVVLITAFKPFDNRGVNGSETVAEVLRAGVPGVQLKVVVLDVVWGEPAAKLPPLIKEHRPRVLIGLGEGFPGAVRVERVARNLCVGPDVLGKMPHQRVVEAGGPPQRQGTLLFDSAWKLSDDIAVTTSDDAGTYLCNALFYTALGDHGVPVERVGFVHLPPQGKKPNAEYTRQLVPIVREMIRRNL